MRFFVIVVVFTAVLEVATAAAGGTAPNQPTTSMPQPTVPQVCGTLALQISAVEAKLQQLQGNTTGGVTAGNCAKDLALSLAAAQKELKIQVMDAEKQVRQNTLAIKIAIQNAYDIGDITQAQEKTQIAAANAAEQAQLAALKALLSD